VIRKPAAIVLVTGLALLALVLLPAALGAKGGNGGGGNPDPAKADPVKGGNGGGGNPDRGPGGGGGGGGGYSVSISPAGPYHFGQSVWATTDAPMYANGAGPYISLTCYQNGIKVGGADHAGFPGGWYYGDAFQLGPSQMWTGGAADCTVTVWHSSNRKMVTDARTSFHVEP
jgi:hypothetical protein